MKSTDHLLVATRGQLAGDLVHLRRLRTSLQSASIVIRQATLAYAESRKLVERIDGVPHARLRSEIHISE